MNFTDIFIKRPVLAICVNLLILVAGYQSLRTLVVRQYPKSDLAIVTVKTAYIGASADLVRGFITSPLERVIASADGIDYLESASAQGLSTITAHLRLNFDVNSALTQIQSKVAQVRNDLPPEAEAPIIEVETSDNRFAAMYLSFFSKDLEQNQITDYLLRVIQPKLSSVAGVQRADILGARTFAMRIWLKSERMAALGVSPGDVETALSANNFLSAPGSTKGSMIKVNLTSNTDLRTQKEFQNLVVRNVGDSLVRLQDVADVVLGAESYDEEVKFGGERATFMGVWVLPNANSLDVIREVRGLIPDIQRSLPTGMNVGIPYDTTAYIQDAIDEVLTTLTETILIVICVIYLFLGSLRSVLVPVVAIALSLVGAAAVMLVFGFTINLLTLLAIVLSVGLVVDDAIVMLENVERHVQEGMKPFDAAIKAARELVGPTIAMTITLATVYAPIGFQGGLTGTLFREFAFTLAGAVLVSGFVALTLSPMMSSKLVRKSEKKTGFKARVDRLFDRLRDSYERLLRTALSLRPAILTGAGLFILIIPLLYMFSTKELAPREDQGVLFSIIQAAPNSSIDQTLIYASEINRIYQSFPETQNTFELIQPSFGFSGMLPKPWSERNRTTLEMEGEAWAKMAGIPGVRAIVTSPPPLPGGSDFPVEFVISSTAEPDRIAEFANILVQKAFQSGRFMFADTDLKFDLPQTEIVLDRDKVASMGLQMSDIGRDLSVMTGGNYVNRFNILGRSYKVIPQLKRSERLNPEQLLSTYVRGPKGSLVPLETFATLQDTVQPRQLNRFQQLNSAKIQGAVPPGTTIDDGLKVLEDAAKEILPKDYSIDYAGESRQLRKEGGALVTTLMLALVLIFLVLASQFESFRDPFIILAGSVPLALAGALIFVFLDATTLNIYSQVGLVTLVGLVSKNGILIVEFANKLQETGSSKLEAVVQAATTRLRPILMTSVATVVGHFPLVLASGAGAGARNSIGAVLVSGMTIGTIFTLFVVPVIYLVVARDHSRGTPTHIKQDGHARTQIPLQAAFGLMLFALSGCVLVGPDYEAPVEQSAAEFQSAPESGFATTEATTVEWWKNFNDPKLAELVQATVANNKSVALSLARLNEARAIRGETELGLFPSGEVFAGWEAIKLGRGQIRNAGDENGENSAINDDFRRFDNYSAGFDMSWEIDLFGRIRRAIERDRASEQGFENDLGDVLRIAISDVARSYFQLRGSQHQLEVAKRNAENQQETVRLVSEQEKWGRASDFDVARATAQLENTRATIPVFETQVRTSAHRIAVLVGRPPQELLSELDPPVVQPSLINEITLGNPSTLLQRRPDVRAAERRLAAATADVGFVMGSYFPIIEINGNIRVEGEEPSQLSDSGAEAFNIGPRIGWNVDFRRTRRRVQAADARTKQALAEYEQSVLTALEDTENALVDYSKKRARQESLARAHTESNRAAQIARERFQVGATDFLSVLEAERNLFQAEAQLAENKTNVGIALVTIYKALGGGWESVQAGTAS